MIPELLNIKCPKCDKGVMLPMYDAVMKENKDTAIYIKGWACNNCENNIFFQAGNLVKYENYTVRGQQR